MKSQREKYGYDVSVPVLLKYDNDPSHIKLAESERGKKLLVDNNMPLTPLGHAKQPGHKSSTLACTDSSKRSSRVSPTSKGPRTRIRTRRS